METGRRLMNVKGLAAYLALSEKTIYRMISMGTLPAIKIGGQWRFDPEAVAAWVRNKSVAQPAASGEGAPDGATPQVRGRTG